MIDVTHLYARRRTSTHTGQSGQCPDMSVCPPLHIMSVERTDTDTTLRGVRLSAFDVVVSIPPLHRTTHRNSLGSLSPVGRLGRAQSTFAFSPNLKMNRNHSGTETNE